MNNDKVEVTGNIPYYYFENGIITKKNDALGDKFE